MYATDSYVTTTSAVPVSVANQRKVYMDMVHRLRKGIIWQVGHICRLVIH